MWQKKFSTFSEGWVELIPSSFVLIADINWKNSIAPLTCQGEHDDCFLT
jgi:hypothetical protein